MNRVSVEYINFDPKLHQEFPVILRCKVYSKLDIINVELEGDRLLNDLTDDIGYDIGGKYVSLSTGQWHNIETGKFISNDDFYDLNEEETYMYDYVSFLIKIYTKFDYRACYQNDFDRKIKVSFIPFEKVNFSSNDSDEIFFEFN